MDKCEKSLEAYGQGSGILLEKAGFSANCVGWPPGSSRRASAPLRAGDAKARENISCYLIRASFSVKKITWSPGRSVIYRTKMVWGPNRNFQV